MPAWAACFYLTLTYFEFDRHIGPVAQRGPGPTHPPLPSYATAGGHYSLSTHWTLVLALFRSPTKRPVTRHPSAKRPAMKTGRKKPKKINALPGQFLFFFKQCVHVQLCHWNRFSF
jgi:hypothetical protein